MNKILLTLAVVALSFSAIAKDNALTTSFVSEVKKAADSDGQLTETLNVKCPAPSASGRFLITKSDYEVGKSLGVYIFKENGNQDARLNLITIKNPNDDFESDIVSGMEFGFTMTGGQFFLTVMKDGVVKAGVSANNKPGIKEIACKAIKAH